MGMSVTPNQPIERVPDQPAERPREQPKGSRLIWRRVAQLGVLFFLLKGIAWLVVAGLAWWAI